MKVRIMKNILKNNFGLFLFIFKESPFYIIFSLFIRSIRSIRSSFIYVFLIGYILSFIETNKSFEFIAIFLAIGTVLIATSIILEMIHENYVAPIFNEQITSKIQSRILDILSKADVENYDSKETYSTILLANEEALKRPQMVIENIFNLFEYFLTTFLIIFEAINIDIVILIISIVSFLVGIILTKINADKIVLYDTIIKEKDKIIHFLFQYLYIPEYAKENRLSKIHNNFFSIYKETIDEKQKIVNKNGKAISKLKFIKELFCTTFCIDFAVPLYLSAMILLFHRIEISTFVMAINGCNQIQLKFDQITDGISEFVQNGRYLERLRDLDKLKKDIETTSNSVNENEIKDIAFNDVSFSYPDGKFGLHNINLTIENGSKVAIVGKNGCGKSTLIKLLLRLYDPTEGWISFNGTDIKNMDIKSYRNHFGVAYQDFKTYATSVKNNICMGDDFDNHRVNSVLKKVKLLDKIPDINIEMTREFDDTGIMMSGGQTQRLILSRVFYKNSEIIIMDEPTSAMDILFEREFYNLIFEELKDKTIVFISHRLSAITACDKILYMENGGCE